MFASSLISLCVVMLWLMSAPVAAQWSTDAESPTVLGELLGFGHDHEVVATPDGATWVAWIDHQCFASLRVQRISPAGLLQTPGGQILETRDNCDSLSPRIVALEDNTVVVSAVELPGVAQPVYRIDAAGQQLWSSNVITDPSLANSVERLMRFDDGDVLIAGENAGGIKLGRYSAQGSATWDPATVTLPSAAGSNLRIFALVPDGANGAFVLWDAPGTYTRVVLATRIDPTGTPAWVNPLVLVSLPPGSSRHTDPVALADGLGGLILVWTQGAEQATTAVPIRMQHIDAFGNTLLTAQGERIATSAARQFDVRVTRHPLTNDVFVVWRDGPINDQSIRAQRMTLAGQRLWGDDGILISSVNDADSQYSISAMDDNTLGIVVGDTPTNTSVASVMLYRVTTTGQQTSAVIALSGNPDADAIKSISFDDALTVVWQRDGLGSQNELVAQHVQPDGTLGLSDTDGDGVADAMDNCLIVANSPQRDSDQDGYGNICDADLNNDCVINVIDLGLMRSDFFGVGPNADLNGDGVVNVIDLGLLRQAFFGTPGPTGLTGTCSS